jgi:uncharacterized protein
MMSRIGASRALGPAEDAQEMSMTELEQFRTAKDALFAHSDDSPLTEEERQGFHGLRYFPENPELAFEVQPEPFPEQATIEMQTSTGDVQTYARYARFTFEVDGQEAALTIYRDEEGGYFLPFADSLAGKETYGAGRYLEPLEFEDGTLFVDFNYAYNPYCAYNEGWSCPLTPWENRLKVPIRAGEKLFHEDAE